MSTLVNPTLNPIEHALTPIQQGMLFHHVSGGHAGVDLEQIVCELREELDLAALEAAWTAIAARHEALRTEFHWEGREAPQARVLPSVTLPWTQLDWRGLAREEQEARFAEWLRADRLAGFELSRAPLMRFARIHFGETEQRLVWSFHHLLLDGRSFAQVLREVFALYDARGGAPPALAPAPPFRLHVEHLAQRDARGDEAFWRAELAGLAGPTALGFPAAPATSFAPGEDRGLARRSLDALTTRGLRELGRAHGFSLANLVQGALALLLARYGGEREVVLGCTRAARRSSVPGAEAIVGTFINTLPLRVEVELERPLVEWIAAIRARNRAIAPFEETPLVDIQRWSHLPPGRALFEALLVYDERSLDAELRELSGPSHVRRFTLHERAPFPLTLYAYGDEELLLQLAWERTRFADAPMQRALAQLAALLESFAERPHASLAEQRLDGGAAASDLAAEWERVQRALPERETLPDQFEAQARRTPAATALVLGEHSLTYRELDRRADQLAQHLVALGVRAGSVVGLCCARSIELVVALLAIHKAGGAYLPLDPDYPAERLAFQVEDAGVSVLVCEGRTEELFPAFSGARLRLDVDAAAIAARPTARVERALAPGDLAYLIYTSGSTGRPKGVMVEHRNVVNFFAGMDERLGARPGGVWLAVTSLSFDISVLELLWTLTRGFAVVLYTGEDRKGPSARAAGRELGFSLFYFASDEGERTSDKYRLLLEGARRADEHGFEAVWSPERHFHAFGGLYPSPAVASAALASITKRIRIRAGSVVMPLHDPLRVAEEWALVDNLSNGRVGISFASGWQPNDFVLAPQAYARRKELMLEGIAQVRALWRGEALERTLPSGEKLAVRTLPRPVQKELPVWLTTAGNVETWRAAGEIGANVLTHLLGQSVEELREKVAAYRAAWKAAGHGPGEGRVTIMLHTFVGDDDEEVRRIVRQPMIEYLRGSANLVQSFVASFPTFRTNAAGEAEEVSRDFRRLSPEDFEAILDNAFERYYGTSGLFGTVETCERMIERLVAVGIDEVACLIDFGVDSELALEHIEHLDRLRRRVSRARAPGGGASIAELIRSQGVTHLQCTPSMAAMVLAQEGAAEALGSLELLLIGGEAFPPALARDLGAVVRGRIVNMYGPTETTIWSSTYELRGAESTIPIGRPIANTLMLVLDEAGHALPPGIAGELWIGGAGVARGYHARPELTAERFAPHPLASLCGGRLYRTGDLVRRREDGELEFLGRADQQVKLRGYRIELGEIEAALCELEGVREAACVVRADASGEQRLLAYAAPKPGAPLDSETLRRALRERLPDFMIPARLVVLDALPKTPNQKIDRKALPEPEALAPAAARVPVALASELERQIAAIWQEVLGIPAVGRDDNFFDLGGHSLLTVQVQGRLRRTLGRAPSITDLFRFPTVRALADFLGSAASTAPATTTVSADRVQARTEGADRRAALLERRRRH